MNMIVGHGTLLNGCFQNSKVILHLTFINSKGTTEIIIIILIIIIISLFFLGKKCAI